MVATALEKEDEEEVKNEGYDEGAQIRKEHEFNLFK